METRRQSTTTRLDLLDEFSTAYYYPEDETCLDACVLAAAQATRPPLAWSEKEEVAVTAVQVATSDGGVVCTVRIPDGREFADVEVIVDAATLAFIEQSHRDFMAEALLVTSSMMDVSLFDIDVVAHDSEPTCDIYVRSEGDWYCEARRVPRHLPALLSVLAGFPTTLQDAAAVRMVLGG